MQARKQGGASGANALPFGVNYLKCLQFSSVTELTPLTWPQNQDFLKMCNRSAKYLEFASFLNGCIRA